MHRGDPVADDRVLHVALADARGGAEVVVETILQWAQGSPLSRYQHVVAVPARSTLIGHWRGQGLTVLEVPELPRFRDLPGARRLVDGLASAMQASGAAVVHTHAIAGQLYGGRAAAQVGCPVTWHIHDRRETGFTLDGVLHRLAARARVDVAIAVSAAVAESWRGRVSSDRLEVIHNGAAPEPVVPAPRPAQPFVVWCGRLQHWKGTHVFLEVAATVRRLVPDARFAVVGGTVFGLEPGYPEALRRQADTLGIADVLEWVGHVDDARPWLAAADVVTHTSTQPEPFGLVIVEAMMQARPVVAFRQGGPAEIIEDGRTGRLLPPGDVPAMAAAVADLLRTPSSRERLGTAGRARALASFSVAEMVQRVESAYDRARKHI